MCASPSGKAGGAKAGECQTGRQNGQWIAADDHEGLDRLSAFRSIAFVFSFIVLLTLRRCRFSDDLVFHRSG
jgi:hypothetical protein